MIKIIKILYLTFSLFLAGCEETNVMMATEAGIDAVKAITLSSDDIVRLASESSKVADSQNQLASTNNKYARRLKRLTKGYENLGGMRFSYKVYIANTVNAFAMADGNIRIYSRLMDMFDDDELRFVVGHEVGHVMKQHIEKKTRLSYAAKAVRKGVASQGGEVGIIAASQIGGFVESLLGAQFSQLEEREADDFGLKFLESRGHEPQAAVRALKKLATLGGDHSFLSSHPAPDKRAVRLQEQLAGNSMSIEEREKSVVDRIRTIYEKYIAGIFQDLNTALPL